MEQPLQYVWVSDAVQTSKTAYSSIYAANDTPNRIIQARDGLEMMRNALHQEFEGKHVAIRREHDEYRLHRYGKLLHYLALGSGEILSGRVTPTPEHDYLWKWTLHVASTQKQPQLERLDELTMRLARQLDHELGGAAVPEKRPQISLPPLRI